MMNIERLTAPISGLVTRHCPSRAILVGISGIDCCGNRWLSRQLQDALASIGVRSVASLSAESWLTLPCVRFRLEDPARSFYQHGVRLTEMFEQVVLPLKAGRRVDRDATAPDAAGQFRCQDVDVILLDGIFLFKREFQHFFDLAIWVDCTFETALERLIERRQQHLRVTASVSACERIYLSSQRLHLAVDDPVSATHYTVRNDPRIPRTLKRVFREEVFAA